jgi:hypothetical protein
MDGHEWVKATKVHHAMVKNTHRFLSEGRQLQKREVCQLLYMPSLAGRDHYITEEATIKEVLERTKSISDYTDMQGSASAFKEVSVERWIGLMEKTGLLKRAQSWEAFVDKLYIKLPSGSCRLSQSVNFNEFAEVIGLGGEIDGHLRGNKRLQGELERIGHFSKFEQWLVYAFLKYEVGKNRWLYPTNFDYVVLGLYLMDHCDEAFHAVSGVDMGHDLCGSVATKLDVFRMVVRGAACLNTDGANFNGNHTRLDMGVVYDVLKGSVRAEHTNHIAYQDVQAAADKYMEGLRNRRVVVPRMEGAAGGMGFVVTDTLFSGESTTMWVNTVLLGSLAMSVAEYWSSRKALAWMLLFWKGDDLNGFVNNWLAAIVILKSLEASGMEMEPSKDHVEYGFSEHERCIVTDNGYGGCLMRRVGSLVAAEPQGAQALTMHECLSSLNEARMSLVCRGVEPDRALVIFKAGVQTYMRTDALDGGIWRLCHVPKCNGGFGLWSTRTKYSTAHGELPEVKTRLRIKVSGRFAKFGSAKMTDTMLRDLCARHGVEPSEIKEIRDEMVGESAVVGLGPQKYGKRRWLNAQELAQRGAKLKLKVAYNVGMNHTARVIAIHVTRELKALLHNPHKLRHCGIYSPAECVANELAKTGCMNMQLYMILNRIKSKTAAMRKLTNVVEGENSQKMLDRLWTKGADVAMLFLEGKLN